MKKPFLLFILLTCFFGQAQYTTIPDANFEKALIDLGIDSGAIDGKVLTANISTITKLDIQKKAIQDLTGIEAFLSLENLQCKVNSLTTLDLSKNTALTDLDISFNKLSFLDVSKNLNLTVLICAYNNNLGGLDISSNTNLKFLHCFACNIFNLDVSNNTALSVLDCNRNNIKFLGLSKNLNLTELNCASNMLTSLDVSKNTNLKHLNCSFNQILNLDVSKNTTLPHLNCEKNQISILDVSKNINLKNLYCGRNEISDLDVSKNINLTVLTCSYNKLSSLDVSKTQLLDGLYCGDNKLSSLDVSKNTALTRLVCQNNQISVLDVSANTDLNFFLCDNNQLLSLNVSKNPKIDSLYCNNNLLTDLNLKNGNNKNIDLSYFNLKSNPKLTCIQVDNSEYSNSNWSSKKDATASYSENCSKTTNIINPPVITATGNQTYCPNTSIKIVTGVTITHDPSETGTDAIYIQISSGYVNGQDLLALANPLLHPTITTSWSASEGKLKLYSPTGIQVTYTDFEAAIKDVTYTNSSISPSGTRNFSINLGFGSANYLPSNGHFYEYMASPGIIWTAAKDAAAARTYYGLQGYLATLTAADEAQLAGAQAPGTGWIGGSDAQIEGTWKWVTGPEGLANGGTGTTFWTGKGNGTTTPPFNYANWNSPNEPNDSGNNEDYAHITSPAVGNLGTWNDLPVQGNAINVANGNYFPQGYIVEYGGMPGEPTLQISASTKIIIPKITSSTPSAICGSGSLILQATATDGTVNWYTTPTGGTSIYTGNSFTTPNITTTTSYYVDASNGSCPNGPRTEIIATIKPLPNLPQIAISSTSPVLYCLNDTAIPLAATADSNCKLNWYTQAVGGIASATSPIPITTTAGSTTYYVSQTNTISNCESPRAAIIVTVNPLPTVPTANNISYCNNETAAPLTAIATANCTLNWYPTATGGTPSATSPTPSTTVVGTTSYFVSQTITSTGCEGPRAEIIVNVNQLPTAPIVSNIAYCNLETAIPLTATASPNCTLNWYAASVGGTSSATSPTPSTATVGTTKFYVSQTIVATGCESPRSEISVIINSLPIVNDVTIIQCDADLVVDGKTLFNLTVNNAQISANYTNETFTYYTTLNGAKNAIPVDLIPNELAFQNTTPTQMDVWSRITNKTTGCFSVAKITLKVPATNINPNTKIPFPAVCDDFLDVNGNNNINNNNRDGITTFDFSSTKAIIQALLPPTDVYNINYYRNQADALAELNVISDISNYRNIGYPNSQDIWIRIDSNLDNACYGLGPYLTLNVEALPIANAVTIPRQCDDNTDGIFTFNTLNLESTLLNGQLNKTVTYFDQANNPLKDANGILIKSPFPATFTSTSQTIKAVVTNNTPQHCYDETTIQFIVDQSPVAFAVPSNLTTTCDDEPNPIDQDGKFAFDTATFESTILGGQTGMIVKYYDQNNMLLPSPLPNPFVTNTQNITAQVQNPLNTTCTASTTLNFIVNPVPNIDLNLDGSANELVCQNDSAFFVTLDAGITDGSSTTNYDYTWTKDGVHTGTNSPTLDVNAEGVYTVEVKKHSGCSRIRTLTVTASNIASITSVDVVDLTEVNTITVNVTGPGVYEYSLDEPNGFWQDSNFFNNVPAGVHVVYVNDKNGCGSVHQEIVLVGVPKFFTPNGDGYNDYWSIKGVNETYNSNSIIYIFDRYGKLLKQWVPSLNQGWDGTFNGVPLPADDYWFTLKLEDGRETKGHFSLKR
ncbi:T9SS type B sorting domain-containing protein [Flavobacterium alvei]|uniref:Ig-like domain-containing protein n=1 Tax=Flavobacterium alvei TaxID=2080416 RepID=UPI0026EC734B|nr:T9SS type B sorting domain-containing protein [Flavobacterium alvei]